MIYSYFGNTSLRVKNLLYNFELQLILFNNLFKNASPSDVWNNNSNLQIKYLELLKENNLIESKSNIADLGTKNARVKSAPLEDYGLINRKGKKITQKGYELLNLIHSQSYKIKNEFLQIDLISLFFLKASMNELFIKYLEVFRAFDGKMNIEIFKLLPLIDNFSSVQDFINSINLKNIFDVLLLDSNFQTNLAQFLYDLKNNKLKTDYFKTAKGEKVALEIIEVLQNIFLAFKNNGNETILEHFLIHKKYLIFKKLYLPHFTTHTKKHEK